MGEASVPNNSVTKTKYAFTNSIKNNKQDIFINSSVLFCNTDVALQSSFTINLAFDSAIILYFSVIYTYYKNIDSNLKSLTLIAI